MQYTYKLLIWIMRFILIGLIYVFLYRIIKVMYKDLKEDKKGTEASAGVEVVSAGTNGGNDITIGTVYPLHGSTTIGRMPDNNITIDSQYVSGHHAKIYIKNNTYVVKDMGSTNGTFLNGDKIERPMAIDFGDLIDIGGVVFKVI